jgi:SAM-dependent methyltransferase
MTSFKDHFSAHAAHYAQARPVYPPALYAWLAAHSPARAQAWDAGCGNGQAAVAIAAHFAAVYATDPSAPQIEHAIAHPHVRYAVEPAERCGLADSSVDLVTVAQALHWFDFPTFFGEVARVLKPRGLFAAWSYGLMQVTPEITEVVRAFEFDVVGAYWPPERRHIDDAYSSIDFPFEPVRAPSFAMRHEWTQAQVIDYLGTWSAVQRYRNATGVDPMPDVAIRMREAWGDAQTRAITWPLTLVVRRAP